MNNFKNSFSLILPSLIEQNKFFPLTYISVGIKNDLAQGVLTDYGEVSIMRLQSVFPTREKCISMLTYKEENPCEICMNLLTYYKLRPAGMREPLAQCQLLCKC